MIAKNFKFLYKHFNHRQKTLAKEFNVPQSNISEYVNGRKPIPTDIIKKISLKYGIGIDDLMNKDLALEFDSPQTIKLKDTESFGENLLPFLTSKIARSNDNFNRAEKILSDLLQQLDRLDDFYKNISVFEHVVTLYQKAWEESKSYVAISNCLSTILLIYIFYNQCSIQVAQKLIEEESLNLFDVQFFHLHHTNNTSDLNYKEKQAAFFEKYEDMVYSNIKLLKSKSKFSELGDYFLAICYYFGFAEDFLEFEQCSQTGAHMLLQLCKIDNKYANRFFQTFPRIS